MKWLKTFATFWYDFIVGDDWSIAAGVVASVIATSLVHHIGLASWPVVPIVVVIMLTASDEEPDMARSYDLGANSYIVKPVDFRQFSEVVLQLGLYWLLLNRVPGAEGEPQAPQATPIGVK